MSREADLVLVGGGPAAVSVLSSLAAHDRVATLGSIAVIERADVLGPGLPYGEAADVMHTYGRIPRVRRDKGRALRAHGLRAIEQLRARGVTVTVHTRTEARALSLAHGCYTVHTDGGSVAAPRVVLGTGPWHTNRLSHLERAVDWRWDARRLHAAVRDDEDVLVLGTGQSAVDVAWSLGARRDGVSRAGSVRLASRRGLLPAVWGNIRASRRLPAAARSLDALRAQESVRLDDVYDAVLADIAAAGGAPCEDPRGDPLPRAPRDGVQALRDDLRDAVDSLARRDEIPWQSVLWPTVPAVFDLHPRLCAEDRLRLAPRWSLWLRYLEAIHVGAAEAMVALADAGRLTVQSLGPEVDVTEDALGVVARGAWGEARAHRVVDARGHDPHIDRSDDAFLRSALAAGLVAPARVPFADGAGHLVTGGLWVSPESFRARRADGSLADGLYALGPLTQGQWPIYLGLWALREAAARITLDLLTPR